MSCLTWPFWEHSRYLGVIWTAARLLIDMKAGIGHLAEKLHVVKLDETTVDPNDPGFPNFFNDFTWPTAKSKMILTVTGFDKEGWAFYELCKAFMQFLCSWSTTCLPTSYINLLDAHEDSSSLAVLHPWPHKPQWGKSFGRGTWHRKLDLWVGARGRWTTHRTII